MKSSFENGKMALPLGQNLHEAHGNLDNPRAARIIPEIEEMEEPNLQADVALFMSTIGEFGDNAKITPTSTNAPKEVRILVFRSDENSALGHHNSRSKSVSQGEAVLPSQIARSAARGQTTDS